MLKTLIKAYIESRLNAIDKEIEELSEIMVQEEEKAEAKDKVAQATFLFSKEITKRIKKLRTRISIYLILFGEIK